MPADYGERLAEDELSDLVDYLMTLKREKRGIAARRKLGS